MSVAPAAAPGPRATSAADLLVVDGVTCQFGGVTAVNAVSFAVSRGELFGLIGPNGAGKTTTVKILTGMLSGYGGQARVCGFDVAAQPLEVKRRIGYVPESAALYDALTPREFLQFIGRLYGLTDSEIWRRAFEMLDLFGLTRELDDRMSTFSKGMRQKVLIVAGLIHNPQVIFLDEPLSGLDANSVVIVKEVITRLARHGKAIFYCSHVMDVVERICDRITIINDGRIIADGTFEQLQTQSKAASLERIFTQLTSAGGHEAVADRFIQAFEHLDPHG